MHQRITFIFLLISFFLPEGSLTAQTGTNFPEVTYEQGKIIGNLPYGRHFFIVGNPKLPNGGKADAVEVKIWSTGRTVFRRTKDLEPLSGNRVASVLANPPLYKTKWQASLADDQSSYRLYVDKPLTFASEYMLEFTFSQRVNFALTEAEKEQVMDNIRDKVLALTEQAGGVGTSQIEEIVNQELTTFLAASDQYAPYFTGGDGGQSNFSNLPISQATLENLSQLIGKMSQQQQTVDFLSPEVASAKAQLDTMAADSGDRPGLEAEVAVLQAQLDQANAALADAKDELPGLLQIIRSKLVETYTTYIVSSPEELSVTELNAIRIGTSFGGGFVGFNAFQDNRDADVFGYTALKFYLLPVDKRIADPYISGSFFINRTAVLVGASVSGDLQYNGQVLNKAVGFYPILGLSYDLNRYLSLDVGATLFRQPSISPLTNDTEVRIGPVIGINFDGDLFNRFNALFSGDNYKINPGGG